MKKRTNRRLGEEGFTLVELIMVLVIIGILIAAFSASFDGWRSRYKVEALAKEFYVDLLSARARAMQRNRMHFVTLENNKYTVTEDISPAPEGDQTLTAADLELVDLTKDIPLEYKLEWSDTAVDEFNLSTNGVINVTKVVCVRVLDDAGNFLDDINPDADCLEITPTRIITGKMGDPTAACDASNCDIDR